ncbi:hypothetical protein niasHS_004467 [Heterodera schachtii]|uniref:Integrase catalytic domain-containing protein n=1 Tax=Heterodera schachtii TaxID=97005 RepID=A0ABD2JJ92_HETSC
MVLAGCQQLALRWPAPSQYLLAWVTSLPYPDLWSSLTTAPDKCRPVTTGTQFSSNEFKQFVTQNGITHLFSAPYNPMSNGQAERFVDTFKRTSRKLKGEGIANALETFLVTYRTTPSESLNGKSPAEMFLQRKVRTTLDLLMPKPKQPIVRDEAMEKTFNRRFGAKPRVFSVGDKVYARHRLSQQWKAGRVTTSKGVMYDVEFPNGSTSRFHANQLIKRDTDQMTLIHWTCLMKNLVCQTWHNNQTSAQTWPWFNQILWTMLSQQMIHHLPNNSKFRRFVLDESTPNGTVVRPIATLRSDLRTCAR